MVCYCSGCDVRMIAIDSVELAVLYSALVWLVMPYLGYECAKMARRRRLSSLVVIGILCPALLTLAAFAAALGLVRLA